MSFLELYKTKQLKNEFKLRHKDLDCHLAKDAVKISVDELIYLLLIIDCDTDETVIAKVKRIFDKYTQIERKRAFNKLTGFIEQIDVEVFSLCLSREDFICEYVFFRKIFDNDKISCVDKFILFREILEFSLPEESLNKYANKVIEVSKKVLSDFRSVKGEIRATVALLVKINKELKGFLFVKEIIEELYVNNILWADFYNEERLVRQKTLAASFNCKVGDAFREKDYAKVVRMLDKYADELPESLRKKLHYSKKKLIK